MGHVVQHARAILVFIKASRVTFGQHKNVSVEAWAGGKKYNKKNESIRYHDLVGLDYKLKFMCTSTEQLS